MRFVFAVAVTTITSLVSHCGLFAETDPSMFLSDEGEMWVAGRDMGNPQNRYVAIVLHIEDDEGQDEPQFVKARMWGYRRVLGNRRYAGMEPIATESMWLRGEVVEVGTGRNKRQSLTLTRDDNMVTVWLTSAVQRSKKRDNVLDEELIMCRWRDSRGGRGKGQKFECEDPPTEDILEEEAGVNPEAMTEAMDPEYYE